MLNCKAHISILREPISRDFLKHEVLSEQRPATPIQVKGSHKHRKNATNGKNCLKRNKIKQKLSLKHKNQDQCLVHGSKGTFTAPLVQLQINCLTDWLPVHWFGCCSRNKNCLYFAPLTLTGMKIQEENSETSILVMPKFTTAIAIF